MLFLLGLLAALAVPALGLMDNAERIRITLGRMKQIRTAIIGPDGNLSPGGYVGDMKAWPDLWEPRAEIKPNFTGTGWDTPSALTAGLGQGPDYEMDPDVVFFRPSGSFGKNGWQWDRPYRKLTDDEDDNEDHIGGLETENEGQPRGLWTRYPEELSFDLTDHPAPGEDLGDDWGGPYLTPPLADNLSDSGNLAKTDGDYAALEPVWDDSNGYESWEEGDYDPTAGLGEHFDDKEDFRLLQTSGRLTDGWGRAFRFFITDDPDHDGGTIFWILSEGPDGRGTYPNKGVCTDHVWTVDTADVMSTAYDETDEANQDNLVIKLYSRDWEARFEEETETLTTQTESILARIRRALAGDAPDGDNTGFTGDMTRFPDLFQWEDGGTTDDDTDDAWDNADDADTAYTKGQPRGLWTDSPNALDSDDDLDGSQWGIGWRHAYIAAPPEIDENELLTDAWGREILFFRDDTNGLLLILSRGADGQFDFGSVDSDHEEPTDFTETLDATTYDPSAEYNEDNRHMLLSDTDIAPGFFLLTGFTVTDAVLADATEGTTKARFFRTDDEVVDGVDLLTPSALTDEDGDGTADDWAVGDGTAADPAFNYDDTTDETVFTGARYLVFWNDADDDDEIDSGENYYAIIFNLTAAAGTGQHTTLEIDTGDFRELP